MASTFTFGFSGDDIDADAEGDPIHVDDGMQIDTIQDTQRKAEESELVAPQTHTLTEIVRMPFSLHGVSYIPQEYRTFRILLSRS